MGRVVLTPRKEHDDSDFDRKVKEIALMAVHEKHSRLWRAIYSLFTIMLSIAGAGATLAISDHGTLRENATKIQANDTRIGDINKTLERIDDKLTRLLQRGGGR